MNLLTPEHEPDAAAMGGKGAALVSAARAGFDVPAFFVVPAAPADRRLSEAETATVRGALASLDAERFAVRSSAVGEDGAEHAFAGQLDSFLGVAAADVPAKVDAVRASGAGERAAAYAAHHGLQAEGGPRVAVVVQAMADADSAGVAFSADPVSGRRGLAVVSAVAGLGEALVSGEADGRTWRIDRAGIVSADQSADRGGFDLEEATVRGIADLARACAAHFGRPQDVEWALTGDRLHLLQSRPVTALAGRPDPAAPAELWDNSNIAESYGGVTGALTFSFARRVYAEVYRGFCRLLAVPEKRIAAGAPVFDHLLGRLRGRVYYNLPNWYRILAMLPGYEVNASFMEQMMGVREPLPAELAERLAAEGGAASTGGRVVDLLRLARGVAALAWQHLRLPTMRKRFYERLDEALGASGDPAPLAELESLRLDELAAHYHHLEAQLLRRWDAPLVNDFLAMIFFGVIGGLCRKWLGDEALRNTLLADVGEIVSTEPARRIRGMAETAAADPKLVELLRTGSPAAVRAGLAARSNDATWAAVAAGLAEHLARFGDRCLEELKLESPTLVDDPTPLHRSVGASAARLADAPPAPPTAEPEAAPDPLARLSPLRRIVFRWVLAHARDRVRDRENLRFERTRVFGRVRRIFLLMGQRLTAEGVLDDPRSVFHLEVDELLAFARGDAACDDLRSLAAARAAADAELLAEDPPPERVLTRGAPGALSRLEPAPSSLTEAEAEPLAEGEAKRGTACCPGTVRGIARVVRDPRGVELSPGEVLVAERTDPGWVLLFPAAAAVVVERGSLLSHSAIVARELGLPAVVGVPGLMAWLNTGDEVEVNGATGTVRRIAEAAPEEEA